MLHRRKTQPMQSRPSNLPHVAFEDLDEYPHLTRRSTSAANIREGMLAAIDGMSSDEDTGAGAGNTFIKPYE